MRPDGGTHKNDPMDDHAPQPQKPYPREATGLERKILEISAATGILTICAIVTAMALAMYLLPQAPPSLLAAPLF